jgi:hypothetical protein
MIKLPLVVALAVTVAACDMTDQPKTAQRDVYNSLEDCVADWGDTELCQQQMKEAREHQLKMAEAQAKSGGNASMIPFIFMGPSYYGDSRAVTHNGQTIVPKSTNSVRTANFTPTTGGARTVSYTPPNTTATQSTLSRVSAGKSAFSSTSTSRGGIGATGSSSSSAS